MKFCALAEGENFDWFKQLEACGRDFLDREADYQYYNLQLNGRRWQDYAMDDGGGRPTQDPIGGQKLWAVVDVDRAPPFFTMRELKFRGGLYQRNIFTRSRARWQRV